ncbi:MAG: VOC family protein [Leptospiraceae bacterium]
MQKIVPHLWFDKEAEQAARFYSSVFADSMVGSISRYSEVGHEIHGQPSGQVMTVEFELLGGHKFLGLNGGPIFQFNPSVSFIVNFPDRADVDLHWNRLAEGGRALMPLDSYPFSDRYGWIEDRYGLSWQLIYADYIPEPKIVPSLMFVNDNYGHAEEAMRYYVSLFENSQTGEIFRYGPGQAPDEEGRVAYGDLTLEGQAFAIMESAQKHNFTFNEAISFLIHCEGQSEVDRFWSEFTKEGSESMCGWLKDRYGVSWQIVPDEALQMLSSDDREKADRALELLFTMKKIDISRLNEAFQGSGKS